MAGKKKIVFLSAMAGLLISCSGGQNQIQLPSETEKNEISAIGDPAANLLLKTLQSELLAAIEKNGLAEAIDVCGARALRLTDSLAIAHARIEKIKRTSTKIRNPLNSADMFDTDALAHYAKLSGDPAAISDSYVQKLTDERGIYYRYYKPLQVKPLCVSCHGPAEQISGDLAQKLKENYPGDAATGYRVDDFRGVVSITIR